jgi:uncharacterized protein (TIGR02145 family)
MSKRDFFWITKILAFGIALSLLLSCKKDPTPPDDANFSQSSTSVTAEFDETIINFDVVSNSSWVAKSDQTWCTVNQKAGRNNANISASFSENNTNSARVAQITISNAIGIYQVVTLTQNGLFVNDIDGNSYKIIKIGTQVWMAENLKTTKYSNGSNIPKINDNTAWSNMTTGARCYYNNDSTTNKAIYGGLYNYYAVNDSRKISPIGWHIPTYAEWTILVNYLGGESIAGAKLKEAGTVHWISTDSGVTNENGFTALPGGYRYFNGTFNSIGGYGLWWTGTEISASSVWGIGLLDVYNSIYPNNFPKVNGFSVRCIRD